MSGILRIVMSVAVTLIFINGAGHLGTYAQPRQEPGRSIGTITTQGDLIVMTLEDGVLGSANLFDLAGRTLRFTPVVGGYRGENLPLEWDPEIGTETSNAPLTLQNFAFPFSGQSWKQMSVGVTGSISFGSSGGGAPGAGGGGGGRGGGGVSIGRFDQLQTAAPALVNTTPAICVFMKPRMSGTRHVKELADRVVITWSLTEPVGGIQDFTWEPTVNRFQAVLRKDGAIDLSYEQIAAKDAIVGIYPVVTAGKAKPLVSLTDPDDVSVPAHLDVKRMTVEAVDGVFLKVSFDTRGPVLPEGDAGSTGVIYQVTFDSATPGTTAVKPAVWTIRGGSGGGRGGATVRYTTSGPGISSLVKISGTTISMQGMLPPGFAAPDKVTISGEARAEAPAGAVDQVAGRIVTLADIRSPRVDLSSLDPKAGPFPILYEPFHYVALPNPRDMTCTVIKALGDKFDFLAYYSDFRIDNQEAGTPSTGPRGGGPDGGEVTGIASPQRGVANYCSEGRFQWQFVQPVYVGSNQMQIRPPDNVTDTNIRNIATYREQISRRSPDGKLMPYAYGVSQIAHELGHRWSAFVSARVNGEVIPLGPTHWARGLQAQVPYPYLRPSEASLMGGGVWQDNFDGTFTQLDDDYYVPATGWSYLELYLMGLAAPSEVPDFFILRNLEPAGRDKLDRPIFKATRTKVTIDDVIAVEGPRKPDVTRAQKRFNTGIVVIVEHGKTPSQPLIERANGIREQWIDYFATTTGHRAATTTNPR